MYPTRRIRHYSIDQTQQQAAVPWSGMISSCPDTIVSVSVSLSLGISASLVESVFGGGILVSHRSYKENLCSLALSI